MRILASLLTLAAFLLSVPVAASALDLDAYAAILEAHTRDVDDIATVRVDYDALRTSPEWAALVESLDDVDPAALSRDEQFAFWTNAYNILAIDVVVKGRPENSIRDLGNFLSPVWKKEAGRVNGKPVTLDQIEHEILRPMGDARVHGAVVCASLICPPLRREPYRAATLDAQLDDNVRRWLADPRKGVRVDRNRNTVHLSSILKWFAEDFEKDGGVVAFAAKYAPEADAAWLAENPDPRVRYIDYDWSVNRL